MEPRARPNSPTARPATGAGVGCVALGLAVVVWFLTANAPSVGRVMWEWSEARLHEAALFGSIVAVVVGMGVWSARRERSRWVGFAATASGGVLVARCVVELARPL